MLVEDNEAVGRFAAEMLADLGYEPIWVTNASAALTLLDRDEHGFDLVFSDVVMPGMSGVDFADTVRARLPNLPVVLASGYSHVLADEGRHGFEFIQKPYSVEEISNVLQRAMGRRGGT